MELYFGNQQLEAATRSIASSNRTWGVKCAAKLRQRLVELAAVEDLGVCARVPTHNLRSVIGHPNGRFAVRITETYRLVFEPAHDPVPFADDGFIDISRVTAIRFLAIEETNGN